MTTILNHAKTKTLQIHHQGRKEGVRVRLQGAGTALKDMPSRDSKQMGYTITPAGASGQENISINSGGLVIRARNDKSQTITAKSTPDNQLQVQVGQGKSAVQLSIQVAPQGTRGEIELQCVRNAEEKGDTTGYTVNVKRTQEECRAYKRNQRAQSPTTSPSERSAHSPGRSQSSPERRECSPDRCSSFAERLECTAERYKKLPERRRSYSAASEDHSRLCYGTETRASEDEALCIYPNERPQSRQAQTCRNEQARVRNASPNKPSNLLREPEKECTEEHDADLHYKRKLDTHHHKPTISYLIARRMTELFKEMRKTAELHRPPAFVKF